MGGLISRRWWSDSWLLAGGDPGEVEILVQNECLIPPAAAAINRLGMGFVDVLIHPLSLTKELYRLSCVKKGRPGA